MARELLGAPVAQALSDNLKSRADVLLHRGITPTLSIVRLGDRHADMAYERAATRVCESVGIAVRPFHLPAYCERKTLLETIGMINCDPGIHSCLLLRPLHDRQEELEACRLLAPEKDVDCCTPVRQGNLFAGSSDAQLPCTAQSCIEILDYYQIPLKGKRVTVVGASPVIGKPISLALVNRGATVTVCHIDTVDTAFHCREAEIIISAAGCAGLIRTNFVVPGQVLLDVGINRDPHGNLCGDVEVPQVEHIVQALTPVPGGVGRVTTTVLAKHVMEAAENASRHELM